MPGLMYGRYCISGWETLCPAQTNSGYSVNGGYAQYAVADGRYVVPVPNGISPLDHMPPPFQMNSSCAPSVFSMKSAALMMPSTSS